MGKVRQMRRYKACDPFSKQHGKKKDDKKINLPPKGKDCIKDVHFEETYKVKCVNEILALGQKKNKKDKKMKTQALGKQLGKQLSKKASKKQQNEEKQRKQDLKMQPGETRKQFFNRLDNRVQMAVGKVMEEAKLLRKKRKKHLKARDEKLKQTKAGKEEVPKDFDSLKDDITFGDVAMRPPEIHAKPRKANKETINKTKSLHLSSLMDKPPDQQTTQVNRPKETKPDGLKSVKKRKDMSQRDKLRFDEERQRAIDAYRLIKKKKEDLKNAS